MNIDINERVCRLAAGVFGIPADQVASDSTPDSVASWDSFAQLNLMVALEDEFSIEIDPGDIEHLAQISAIADLVEQRLAT